MMALMAIMCASAGRKNYEPKAANMNKVHVELPCRELLAANIVATMLSCHAVTS